MRRETSMPVSRGHWPAKRSWPARSGTDVPDLMYTPSFFSILPSGGPRPHQKHQKHPVHTPLGGPRPTSHLAPKAASHQKEQAGLLRTNIEGGREKNYTHTHARSHLDAAFGSMPGSLLPLCRRLPRPSRGRHALAVYLPSGSDRVKLVNYRVVRPQSPGSSYALYSAYT